MDDQQGERRGRPTVGRPNAGAGAAWLVPVLNVDDEWTPDVDRALTVVALAARAGSRTARNALYVALAAKIARFVGRYRFRQPPGVTWEIEDVEQEAFLVLADLVDAWSGEGSFARYFLGYFPWRLANAVRQLHDPRVTTSSLTAVEALLHDDSTAADEARALLEALAADLPPADRTLLLLHVRDGEHFTTIARRLLVSRRTVTRRWQALRQELRQTLEPPAMP
jgi:RNA polymerase sigma factor (sigma-70 family)